jgi:nucleoside-diphosphate-sugar epimerase
MGSGQELVLVTGVTGFVGSNVAERLTERGMKVRALVRAEADLPGVEQIVGDMTDPDSLERAVEGADAVIHCAVSYSQDFETARRVDVEGTRHLAQSALGQGVKRFVHISTCGAYDVDGVTLVTEATPLWAFDDERVGIYGRVKAEAERQLTAAHEQGLPTVILRPPNILGAHPRSAWGYSIPKWIFGGDGNVRGEGTNTWPVVSIHNLMDAVESALSRDVAVGKAYTVVDDHTTWGEYAERVASWKGVSLNQAEPEWPYDFFYGKFSTQAARDDLGYVPHVTYDEAMQEIHSYLQGLGLLDGA